MSIILHFLWLKKIVNMSKKFTSDTYGMAMIQNIIIGQIGYSNKDTRFYYIDKRYLLKK